MAEIIRVVPCSQSLYNALVGEEIFNEDNWELIKLDFVSGGVPDIPEEKLKYQSDEYILFDSPMDIGSKVFVYILADSSSNGAMETSLELIKRITYINKDNFVISDSSQTANVMKLRDDYPSCGWLAVSVMASNDWKNIKQLLVGLKYFDQSIAASTVDMICSLQRGRCDVRSCEGELGQARKILKENMKQYQKELDDSGECYMLIVTSEQLSLGVYQDANDEFSATFGPEVILRVAFAEDKKLVNKFICYFFFLNS